MTQKREKVTNLYLQTKSEQGTMAFWSLGLKLTFTELLIMHCGHCTLFSNKYICFMISTTLVLQTYKDTAAVADCVIDLSQIAHINRMKGPYLYCTLMYGGTVNLTSVIWNCHWLFGVW